MSYGKCQPRQTIVPAKGHLLVNTGGRDSTGSFIGSGLQNVIESDVSGIRRYHAIGVCKKEVSQMVRTHMLTSSVTVLLVLIGGKLGAADPPASTTSPHTGIEIDAVEGDVEWGNAYGDFNDDWGYAVQQTTDGGYVVAGYTYFPEQMDYDVSLVKTNSDGDLQWQSTFGGGSEDRGYSVQQTSDGGYMILGYTASYGSGGQDVYLVKTDSDGNQLWQKTLGGTSSDMGYSLQRATDGGYIIAGTTTSYGAGYSDVYLVKTDSDGEMRWQKTFGGSDYERGYSAQQTSDGGYIIAGTTYSYGSGGYDVYLVKTNSDGDQLWQKTFGGGYVNDYGYSVQQTSDGGYIIAGYTYGGGGANYLVKTNSDGELMWDKTVGGGSDYEWGEPVQQTPDGGFIIAGSTDPYGYGSADVYLVKTNSGGETLWEKRFGDPSDDDRAYSVQQTFDSGYIIAGYRRVYQDSDRDVCLIKVSGGIAPPAVHFASDVSTGDEPASPATLAVALSRASSEIVTVGYSVTGGTATGGGVDYTLASGTLTFVPGDMSEDIPLTIVDDSLNEADETVIVTLSDPVNAVLVTNTTHTHTILDDDTNQSTVGFSSAGSCGNESASQVTLAVSLSEARTKTVTVDFSIAGGTATGGGVDYTLASDTLTFAPGDTIEHVSMAIVDDSLGEAHETIIVAVSDPVNTELGTNTTHTYTIIDDDGEGNNQWQKTFGGSSRDGGFSVQQTSDGGYIVAGYTDSYGSGGYDVYLVRTSPDGDQLWQTTFGGSSVDSGGSVQQTSDGGYIIAGSTRSYGSGSDDMYLVKTNGDGELQWERAFGNIHQESGRCVRQTSDGGYVLVGTTASYGSRHSGHYNVYMVKTNSEGDLQWQKAYGGIDGDVDDYGHSVQQTSDGGYVIAGTTYRTGMADVYLVKTNAIGVLQWENTFGGSGGEGGDSVQQTSDGGYVIAGSTTSYGSGQYDVYLVKTDSDGQMLWQKTFGGSGYEFAYSVQQTSDGGYITTGYTDPNVSGSGQVRLVKTNSDGNLQWQKTFGGSDDDYAWSVQQTCDGGYIVAGSTNSYGSGGYDVYLIKASGDAPPATPGDMNGDGIVSIVGDVPPFVQVVYFQDYTWYEEQFPGRDPVAVGDCNEDGILSIVGDVPCFVDCVYFGNCP